MNLARTLGRYAQGCYATVFFVDDAAVKVFKRRDDLPPDRVRDVFKSEVDAYQRSRYRIEICQYTKHFWGVRTVCRIKDERGRDISHEYHLDCAYEMAFLPGEPKKIGELEQNLAQRIRELFRGAGVMHMNDCSVFLDHHGELTNVIDFAMQAYEPESEYET